jgi:tetratricopeptide (TPR) repeat protein
MNPTQPETYRLLGLVLTQLGRYDEAERAFRDSLSDETAYAAASLGYLQGVRGRRDEADAVLGRLEERARTGYVSPVAFLMVHLGLGNFDQVFTWLLRSYEERRGWLAYLKVDPMVDPIRNDPRFGDWLARMNLNR